jgi:hypothetical protein
MPDDTTRPTVTIWLDPVCPFSWNTARWLKAVADKTGLAIEWRLMSLAVLNEGREMPPQQQSRMRDSERIGRLMAAIRDQHGNEGLATAYFAFAERYLDQSEPVDDQLVAQVLGAVKSWDVTTDVLSDSSWDERIPVRLKHCSTRWQRWPQSRSSPNCSDHAAAESQGVSDVSCGAMPRLRQDHLGGLRCARESGPAHRAARSMVQRTRTVRTCPAAAGTVRQAMVNPTRDRC